MPLDVIWNTLSVVHFSSAFNNDGNDNKANIIREINQTQTAIVILDLLEMLL